MKNSSLFLFTFSLIIGFCAPAGAQKYDYNWLFGYASNDTDSTFGGTDLNFNYTPVEIFYHNRPMDMYICNASISNEEGALLFYTNGCYIANSDDQLMENGDTLNPGYVFGEHCADGGTYPSGTQSALILPQPGHPDIYYLFHKRVEVVYNPFDVLTKYLYYTKVDMSYNNGLGKVVAKHVPILHETIGAGELTAVKHSNGNDWWLITPQLKNDKYYTFLFTSEGIVDTIEQQIGNSRTTTGGQAVFSPDGTKYIRYQVDDDLYIFDFDRSTGLLSNFQFLPIEELVWNGNTANFGGCAISPNSRYLYLSAHFAVYQYDLEATDIAASGQLIAEYDGFQSPFTTNFYNMQLGPDCRIYINSTNGVDVLHVINYPDRPGLECQLVQHGVQLPTYHGISLPHFPNYRLGEVPTYPCDSTIFVGASHFSPPPDIRLYPNPAKEAVYLYGGVLSGIKGSFFLYDVWGRKVLEELVSFDSAYSAQRIVLGDKIPPGVYFYNIVSKGNVIQGGKLMVSGE